MLDFHWEILASKNNLQGIFHTILLAPILFFKWFGLCYIFHYSGLLFFADYYSSTKDKYLTLYVSPYCVSTTLQWSYTESRRWKKQQTFYVSVPLGNICFKYKKLLGIFQTIMLAPILFFKWFGPFKNKEIIADILCYNFYYYELLLPQINIHQFWINGWHSMLAHTVFPKN